MWQKKLNIYSAGIMAGIIEALYILLVVSFMSQTEHWFSGQTEDFIIGIIMLLLFVVSAAISGLVILGYPTYLALNKEFKQAFKTVALSILTLFIIWALIIIGIILL